VLYLRSDTVHTSVTRGRNFKLVPEHCRHDLRKYYFTNRVVPTWNSLPIDVVMADNINLFKKCLDILVIIYFVYLFRAQPLGTGTGAVLQGARGPRPPNEKCGPSILAQPP